MPELTAVVNDVTSKSATRKADNKQFFIYEIHMGGETLATTNRGLAEIANSLKNQTAHAVYSEKQKGSYVNKYLEHIEAAPQFNNLNIPASFNNTEILSAPPGAIITHSASAGPVAPPKVIVDKDAQIQRMAAAKVSAHLSQNMSEFWENVDVLTMYFATGEKPAGEDIPF